MKTVKSFGVSRAMLAVGALLLCASAWSADPAPATSGAQAAPSKEMRAKMAAVHEQMAACLRSDKAFAECRKEMMQSCQQTVGSQSCPMMGMGMGPGMGHGHTQPAPGSSPK